MISIADILFPEDILLDLNVSGAAALFDEVGQVMQRWHGLPRVVVAEALAQREAFGSTALGQGVAIPHGRIKGLRQTHAAYVRPSRPMANRSRTSSCCWFPSGRRTFTWGFSPGCPVSSPIHAFARPCMPAMTPTQSRRSSGRGWPPWPEGIMQA